jgi:hypothetical protein
MSDERFPDLKNFLKPTAGGSARSDKTPSEEFSALLALNELGGPEKNFPTEIVLITSSGKKLRFHCSSEKKRDEKKSPINFDEVRRALEDAVEAAEERSAILENDGGLQRQEADETARAMHIQPAIEDLLRLWLVFIAGSQMSTPPSANLQSVEAPQTNPLACMTCAGCPWHQLNPWSRDPAQGAWCHYRMEGLVVGSPVCDEFQHGAVPPRQNHEPVPQVQPSKSPATQVGVLTCADCSYFETNHGPNPRQGWGKCLKRGRGRYGCAAACEAALT